MEKLTTCCKILYDYDMIDKIKKIKSLEEDLSGPPTISFTTFGEFQCKKIDFLKKVKKTIYDWCNCISKNNFTNKDYVVRGLKTCNYDHLWHQHTLVPLFNPLKTSIHKLLHKFYDIDYEKKRNTYLINMIGNIFTGIVSTFYVFTQLDMDFETNFIDIFYFTFEKQIYIHLFLKEKKFKLECSACGGEGSIHFSNICMKCSYIKTF